MQSDTARSVGTCVAPGLRAAPSISHLDIGFQNGTHGLRRRLRNTGRRFPGISYFFASQLCGLIETEIAVFGDVIHGAEGLLPIFLVSGVPSNDPSASPLQFPIAKMNIGIDAAPMNAERKRCPSVSGADFCLGV